jgi:hypothetical protein
MNHRTSMKNTEEAFRRWLWAHSKRKAAAPKARRAQRRAFKANAALTAAQNAYMATAANNGPSGSSC